MDVPQIPNLAEPITFPETSVVKNGKLSNKNFGNILKRKMLLFSKQLSLFPPALKFSSVKITKKKEHATA
jgi:hypothetical protein